MLCVELYGYEQFSGRPAGTGEEPFVERLSAHEDKERAE